MCFRTHDEGKTQNLPENVQVAYRSEIITLLTPFLLFRYFYPFPVPPLLYQVELSVGGQQFNGKGKTRQAAKHDAAAKALRTLQSEPLPERPEGRRPGEQVGAERHPLGGFF